MTQSEKDAIVSQLEELENAFKYLKYMHCKNIPGEDMTDKKIIRKALTKIELIKARIRSIL